MSCMMRVPTACSNAAQVPLVPVVRSRAQACKRQDRLRARASSSDKKATVLEPEPDAPLDIMTNDRTGQTAGDFFKSCVQLAGLQVFCGFLVAPVIANLLEDVHVTPVIGPLVSQLLLVWGADFVITRALTRGGTSNKVFFRYIAKPLLLIEAVVAAAGAIGVGVAISNVLGSPVSSTSIDLRQLLDPDMPSTMMATGLTTVALTPWIEERIWRGFVLQGAIPFVGIPGAVAISSVGYAAIHLSVYGFPQLLMLGVLLGSLNVYAARNLLLPTITHSLFNTVILGAVLLSLPPQAMTPALPPVPGVTQ